MTAGTARFPPVVERTPRSSRRNHPPRDTSEEDSDASSSRSSRRRTRRREKEPMKYDGSTDVKDYLLYFDLLAEMNGWSDRECGLQLATSLVGDAREVLSSVPPGLTRDFASLEQALLTRFSPEGRESSFTVLLWNRTCKKSESVSAFGHAVRKLAKEAYPGVKIHEQILVDIFTKGLPSPAMHRHYIWLDLQVLIQPLFWPQPLRHLSLMMSMIVGESPKLRLLCKASKGVPEPRVSM